MWRRERPARLPDHARPRPTTPEWFVLCREGRFRAVCKWVVTHSNFGISIMDITLSFYGVYVKSLRANSGTLVWLPYGATVRDAARAYENMKGVKVLSVVGAGCEMLFMILDVVIPRNHGGRRASMRLPQGLQQSCCRSQRQQRPQ